MDICAGCTYTLSRRPLKLDFVTCTDPLLILILLLTFAEEMGMAEVAEVVIVLHLIIQHHAIHTNHHSNHTIMNQMSPKYGVHTSRNNIFQTVANGGLQANYVH